VPVDNPATHLELTMVHEAMVLEYSGRHLAMIEWASALKLMLYISMIACIFLPVGMASGIASPMWDAAGAAAWLVKDGGGRCCAGGGGDVGSQDAGLPSAQFPRRRPDAGLAWRAAAVRLT